MDERIPRSDTPAGTPNDMKVKPVTWEDRYPLFPRNIPLLAFTRLFESDELQTPLRFELLYRALRLSSSYRMAHMHVIQGGGASITLPNDFLQVQKTYAALGPVDGVTFPEWYIKVHAKFNLKRECKVQELFKFPVSNETTDNDMNKAQAKLLDYLKTGPLMAGNPIVAILGVPLMGNKKTVIDAAIKAINDIFDKSVEIQKPDYTFASPCYEMSIGEALELQEKKISLGEISKPALRNKEYDKAIRKYKKNLSHKERETRQYDVKYVTRKFETALFIAENSARGDILLSKEVKDRHYVPFNIKQLRPIVEQYAEMKRQLKSDLVAMKFADLNWQSFLGPGFSS